MIDVVRIHRERWPDLQHIVGRPLGPDENALLAQTILHVLRRTRGRGARRAIRDEVHAHEEPAAPHVADDVVAFLQGAQSGEQVGTGDRGLGLQLLVVDDAQHFHSDPARERAAAEGREELDPIVE